MPVFINGISAATVTFDSSPRSVLSMQFYRELSAGSNNLLVTTVAGSSGPISFPLSFGLSSTSPSDVVLGLDWAAYLRDSLLALGHRLDSSFDARRFLSEPTSLPTNCAIFCFPCSSLSNPDPVSTTGGSAALAMGNGKIS
jgi:hypothetical protein